VEQGAGSPISYWRASDALSGYVSGYHRYAVALPPGAVLRDALFPGWSSIRFALTGSGAWSVRLGSRRVDPVPTASFHGPSSYAGYVETGGGTLVGVGLLPMGWAALFGGDISRHANRVVPAALLDPYLPALGERLNAGEDPAAVFEEWLLDRLARSRPIDPRIVTLYDLLSDATVDRIEGVADALDMSQRALAAFTRLHFGFTPKLLLRRGRFLRALSGVLTVPDAGAALLEEAGYWDRSHFLRDCHLFLGCSVREFEKRRGPLNQMAMNVRAAVIGAPV
jgi:AraC-like DNA-binding protein